MPPVDKFIKGGKQVVDEVLDFSTAAAKKRSKDMERAALEKRLKDMDQLMEETAGAWHDTYKGVDEIERYHPGLRDFAHSKEAEWFNQTRPTFDNLKDPLNRQQITDRIKKRFNITSELESKDIDTYFDLLSKAGDQQTKYDSYAARHAEIEDLIKKLSAALGVPPAAVIHELSTPVGHVQQNTTPLVETIPANERQRIEDEYGLTTQSMLDRYMQKPKPYEHQTYVNPVKNMGDAALWGLSEIPVGYVDLAAMAAPYTLPGRAYELATNKSAREELERTRDRTAEYWRKDLEEPESKPERFAAGIMSLLF